MDRSTDVRSRIVSAAAELLASGGREAVSTRAVSEAAGVQAPAIYRQFADMEELRRVAARELLARYVHKKATQQTSGDPLDDLRRGWDEHVAFGLANGSAYTLLYAADEPAAEEDRAGWGILEKRVARLAEVGRLRVGVAHGANMLHAAGRGVTLMLLAMPASQRDPRLSESVREAILGAILAPDARRVQRPAGAAVHAVALSASLDETGDTLSAGERQLLGEWLDRLAASGAGTASAAPARPKKRAK